MNLICKIFGHKNIIKKTLKIRDSKAYYTKTDYWHCLRCGECTQRLYFSNLTDNPLENEKYERI